MKYPTEVMLLWCFIISLHPLYVSNYCIPHLLYFQYAPLLFPSSAPLPVSLSSFFSPHPLSLWYSSSQPISSPRYLPYPCFFTITTSSSTPSPLPAPPPTSSLITSYKFLPLSFIFSMPSPPPPLRLTPPPSPRSLFIHSSSSLFSPFFSHHLSSFPFSHLSSRSLFLPFFYFHPLLLSQSWSLYLIHQSSKPVMI